MQVSKEYKNVFRQDKYHSGVISIFSEPQVAIGQRAFLLCTDKGNILWDCITYLDDETIERVNALGGISAIVISHPHYYSTALHWAEAFNCKVYLSAEDEEWVMRKGAAHVMWKEPSREFLDGQFVAVKVGGHFPGSSVLLWKSEQKLFVADSITVVPSGVYHVDRPVDTASFTFMWSYPNMVSCADAVSGRCKTDGYVDRSPFLLMRYTVSGKQWPTLTSRILMERFGLVIPGGGAKSVCLRALSWL